MRVVVTGAGGGIGAALARRFAADGAQVVLNDVNSDAVKAVAAEVGGRAFAGDAGDEEVIKGLVGFAKAELGGIDLYCANAGVLTHGGPETPDEAWRRDIQVNVMSHVYASRALLPEWLEQGKGHFLATVSAAGLLTLLGSATYSVTKHASLAYAEWLRMTYAHKGIKVQALCPQGVRTDMMARGNGESAAGALLDSSALEPDVVAEVAAKGITGDNFLILPHPEVAEYFQRRASNPDRWLAGMNKMQRSSE